LEFERPANKTEGTVLIPALSHIYNHKQDLNKSTGL